MARLTVDVESLFVQLFQAAFPDCDVRAAVDVDAAETLPMIIIRPVVGAAVSNGSPGMGWSWTVAVSVIASGQKDASDLADAVYEAFHGFDANRAQVDGVGRVGAVEDESMPTRTATVIEVDNLTQFDGSWTAIVRPPQ